MNVFDAYCELDDSRVMVPQFTTVDAYVLVTRDRGAGFRPDAFHVILAASAREALRDGLYPGEPVISGYFHVRRTGALPNGRANVVIEPPRLADDSMCTCYLGPAPPRFQRRVVTLRSPENIERPEPLGDFLDGARAVFEGGGLKARKFRPAEHKGWPERGVALELWTLVDGQEFVAAAWAGADPRVPLFILGAQAAQYLIAVIDGWYCQRVKHAP